MLLSVGYDGKKRCAVLKLLELDTQKVYYWYDNTGHKPYLLTDLPQEVVLNNPRVVSHPGFHSVELVKKYDSLNDRKVLMTKVKAKDPLSIGGGGNDLRTIIRRVWEARIKYHNCYIYDRRLVPGMLYVVRDGRLKRVMVKIPDELKREVYAIFEGASEELKTMLEEWLPLFFVKVPKIERLALDIEVFSPEPEHVPDPKEAKYAIIAISLVSTDGLRKVLVLEREDVKRGERPDYMDPDVEVEFFKEERDLILAALDTIIRYPVLLTYNGDDFDLRYIWNRARRLGITRDQIPFTSERDHIDLVTGVHVDLYRFFENRSIQVYAFSNKYKEVTLDAISQALLGIGKVKRLTAISELSLYDLAAYCFRDARLTLELTTFNDDLVMKLIVLLMRITKLSINEVTRTQVSTWIRNLVYYEHRRLNYLIPNKEDILQRKGETTTRAIIKGKKYKGAIVIQPKVGVHFNVVVLDFASLYPSIISRWNLSYDTVRCPHPECRKNKVPGTPHWVCTKRRGILSQIIWLLRDIRVYWFKPKSKDKSLPEDRRSLFSVVQQALKVILNASYGVFGAEEFPLYCPPVAESTTAIGRYVITRTTEKAREIGLEVLYGDTDSVFIHNPDPEKLKALMEWSSKELGIDLDIDKKYRYVTFSGLKKNYLGVFEDGTVDIKGLIGKKSNTPEFVRETFYEVVNILGQVKSFDEFKEAKERIRKIMVSRYTQLKNRRLTLDKLAIRVMMSKPLYSYTKTTPQHVKAAKQLASAGKHVKPGDVIWFVKVRGPEGVKPVQLARIDEIDPDKYVDYMKTAFEQILEPLDIDFDSILGGRRLDSFFNNS